MSTHPSITRAIGACPLKRMSGSAWCTSGTKRAMDLCCAGLLLSLLWPLMVVIAALIKTSSPGPVLFRQRRVGLNGVEFELLKFRTMTHLHSSGPGVTQSGDTRVTNLGKYLRKWKLDELPQLFNVMAGDMSLVGPRPDLKKYMGRLNAEDLRILTVRPGITGAASIQFRNEEEMLANVPPQELESFYVRTLLRTKLDLDWQYAQQATFWSDLRILVRTLLVI